MAYDERQSAVAFAGDPVHVFQERVGQLEWHELVPMALTGGPKHRV